MHHHISGMACILTGLYALVFLGTLNALAMHFMNRSSLAKSYANLFGLS